MEQETEMASVCFEVGVTYSDGQTFNYGTGEPAERRAKYLAGRNAGSVIVRREVRRGPWMTEQSMRASATWRGGWSDRSQVSARPSTPAAQPDPTEATR